MIEAIGEVAVGGFSGVDTFAQSIDIGKLSYKATFHANYFYVFDKREN